MTLKHGYAFGDHIKTEKVKKRRYDEDKTPLKMRWYLLPATIVVLGFILVLNLFSVQVIQGSYYGKLSDSNRIRTQIIHAPRGVIFDRNGTPLVFNTPGFRQIKDCDPQKKTQCKITHLSKEEALPLIAQGAKNIEVDSLRQYPYKEVTSHVLGYIGQISPEELSQTEFADYQGLDWVGKSGIEKTYEHALRGTDGRELVEVDATGKKMRSLGETDPVPGQDITLTIDLKIQQAAYAAAADIKKGAIVVSKPNGEILAMVSKPAYDPNLFTLDETYKPATDSAYPSIEKILTDNDGQPLLNRAVEGTYPPGSTFKIITAAAGLQDHIIDANYRVKDTGILKVGEFSFANWYYTDYGKTEPGELDVKRALARSNDIFFYKLAEKVTVSKLSALAEKLGVGEVLGIDIGNEAAGVLPTKDWKKKHIKEDWYLGDTYQYGIGQGYLLTTPLQVNSWTEALANNGNLNRPHIFSGLGNQVLEKNILDPQTISLVREGMIQACSQGGVAWPLFDYKVNNPSLKINGKDITKVASGSASMRHVAVACKTGTAQHGGEKTLPHAWITLFAPAYNPQIVVTVLNEASGEGSNMAAPVAKKILDAYFAK